MSKEVTAVLSTPTHTWPMLWTNAAHPVTHACSFAQSRSIDNSRTRRVKARLPSTRWSVVWPLASRVCHGSTARARTGWTRSRFPTLYISDLSACVAHSSLKTRYTRPQCQHSLLPLKNSRSNDAAHDNNRPCGQAQRVSRTLMISFHATAPLDCAGACCLQPPTHHRTHHIPQHTPFNTSHTHAPRRQHATHSSALAASSPCKRSCGGRHGPCSGACGSKSRTLAPSNSQSVGGLNRQSVAPPPEAIGLYYSTATGKTQEVADKIKDVSCGGVGGGAVEAGTRLCLLVRAVLCVACAQQQ